MDYGHRIAELREKRGMTQEELSNVLEITRASLSHYEKGRRKPDFETLTRLADTFNVSVDYLLGRTSQPEMVLDEDVRGFVDALELSDREVLNKFELMIDGKPLSEEEARRFIAFVRMERNMDS
ncbi:MULTISPECIES: helix-turn-helix transcriptional regulator [unclassified Paenibacillus]|uniref:Helix-turn-helix domain-containing protein n=1 Tax=Paenibacillus provencensis TaxID=441151 RepID=A0ABW3PU63_9BACL|nr:MULTISPECIES: helix-turn-helix transcriptional regulator [unclassified Paenibacillus]MCM3127725.1 helix-turn-helix transcriptional regulator [Paenibacillus sp. MER 78]SFS38783.1 DNA-binding transcriptional regulator, XRE-family HTH domain [Paenibacillus sp. 453mf]